jgi:hypothetical protein
LLEIGQKLAKYMFLAMNVFFWPKPSKIGQFEQKWPINWPSGIPAKKNLSISVRNRVQLILNDKEKIIILTFLPFRNKIMLNKILQTKFARELCCVKVCCRFVDFCKWTQFLLSCQNKRFFIIVN